LIRTKEEKEAASAPGISSGEERGRSGRSADRGVNRSLNPLTVFRSG